MTDKKKITLSRRKLLGNMGKLAYVAPTLTFLSVVQNAQAQECGGSLPPCPPGTEGANPKQKSRTESRRKKPKG